MKIDYINPFLSATVNVIQTMSGLKLVPGKPSVKADNRTWGIVSGVIGMASAKLRGNMVVSFDQPSILSIVSKLLGEEFTTIDQDVIDAVGELTNMISGNAKKELSEKGFKFDMALPVMILGKDVEIMQLTKGPILSIPFDLDRGKFVVEASLVEV
jgi:chemotaxis protein CheX